jgi:hypothetical protein
MRNLSRRGLAFESPRNPNFSFILVAGIIDREPKGYCASRRSRALRSIRRRFVLDQLASSRANRARFAAVVTVLLAASFLIGASFFSVSKDASAGMIKVVRGHIYDGIGNPLGGANVTIKVIRGINQVDIDWYDSSEADGLYTVTFGDMDNLLQNDTIEVTAIYSGNQSTNSAIADGLNIQFIDVIISEVTIPEFGSLSVVVVCGAFVAIFILVGRRRVSL